MPTNDPLFWADRPVREIVEKLEKQVADLKDALLEACDLIDDPNEYINQNEGDELSIHRRSAELRKIAEKK